MLKRQGGTVDAIAQAGRWWAVGKDMAEMRAAIGAADFRAGQSIGGIRVTGYRIVARRCEKARPAGAGCELGV